LTISWYVIYGLSYYRKTYPVDIFLPRKGTPSLDYHYLKQTMAMKPLGGGDFDMGDTTRNKQTNNNKPLPWRT
jgi:hypothetical protein